MTTIELKKVLTDRIAETEDVWFHSDMLAFIDSKTKTRILKLSNAQRLEIEEAKNEISQGLYIEQAELEKEFDQWLKTK